MARYFIDFWDRYGMVRDEEGANFAHLEDALEEAKASALDLAKQYMDNRLSLSDTCVQVRDEQGKTVASLTVAEVLAHPMHPAFKNGCSDAPQRGHH